MEEIIYNYLRRLKVPVSKSYLSNRIVSHPDYPSLLSVADTLERFGINYKAVRIDKKKIRQIDQPYLLWPDESSGKPVLIQNKEQINNYEAWETLQNGSVEQTNLLKIDDKENISDPENERQLNEENFYFLISSTLLIATSALLLVSFFQVWWWINSLLILSSLAGLVTGYFLIVKEVGVQHQSLIDFCGNTKRINCDKVLESKGATLFGLATLSDAAVTYFLSQLIVIGLLIPFSSEVNYYSSLGVLALLTAPAIGYSLYYQGFIIKVWCKLCLLVNGVLVIQLSLFIYLFNLEFISINSVNLYTHLQVCLIFICVGTSLVLVKKIITKANKSDARVKEYYRLKHSPSVFKSLLFQNEKIKKFTFSKEFVIGNKEAPINIVIASNLYCLPCKEQHEIGTNLISTYPNKVKITIRFVCDNVYMERDTETIMLLLSYWIDKIYGKENETELSEKLLSDWFSHMDIDKFRKQRSISRSDYNTTNHSINHLLDQHLKWTYLQNISKTPTIFLNGLKLPLGYNLEDVFTLMPTLVFDLDEKKDTKIIF
jgi:uncharacterized membrane protein